MRPPPQQGARMPLAQVWLHIIYFLRGGQKGAAQLLQQSRCGRGREGACGGGRGGRGGARWRGPRRAVRA